jgi:hypothetical protein
VRIVAQTFGPIVPCSQISISCSASPDYEFFQGDFISSTGTQHFINKVIKINGTLILDVDVSFECCHFIMTSGSNMRLLANKAIEIAKCEIRCGNWGPILCDGNNSLNITDSYFYDFTTGFEINNPELINFTNNNFISNFLGTGIKLFGVDASAMARCFISSNTFISCFNGIEVLESPIVTIGYYSYNNNEFRFCRRGISTNKSNIYIQKSIFNNCGFGIRTVTGTNGFGYIYCKGIIDDPTQYTFKNCITGIGIANSHQALIENCHYYDTQFGNEVLYHSSTKYKNNKYENYNSFDIEHPGESYFLYSTISNTIMENNITHRGSGGSSFLNFGPMNCTATENKFYGTNTNENLSDQCTNYFVNNKFYGTSIWDVISTNDFYDNDFFGSDISFRIQTSKKSTFCNNTFDGTYIGFTGNKGLRFYIFSPSHLGGNKFKNYGEVAFECEKAELGTQLHLGNQWQGGNNIDARLIGDVNLSKFIVNPSINSEFLPPIRIPSNGWFIPNTGSTNTCLRNKKPQDGIIETNDELEISGNFESSPLNEWMQSVSTFTKLYYNQELLSNPTYAAYYNSKLGTNVEYISMFDIFVTEAKNTTGLDSSVFTLREQTVNIVNQIADINEQLAIQNDPQLEIQKQNSINQLASINDSITILTNEITSQRISSLNQAQIYNNQINANTNNLILHEKHINDLIIEKMLDFNFTLDANDSIFVHQVSNLCIEEFGVSVPKSIGLINQSAVNINMIENNCIPAITTKTSQLNETKEFLLNKISAYELQIKDKYNEIYHFKIFDIDSHFRTKGIISDKIDISNLRSGIYLIEFLDQNNKVLSIERFIKA